VDGVLWAVVGAALFSGSGAVDKYILEHRMGNPWSYYAFSTFVFFLLYGALGAPWGALRWPAEPTLLLAVSALSWGSIALYYLALREGDLSSVLPLGATRPLLAIPLAMLLIGEFRGPDVVGGICLAAAGGVLSAWPEKGGLRGALASRVLWFVLGANLLIVVANTLTNPLLRAMEPAQLAFWRYGLWCLLFIPVFALRPSALGAVRRDWRRALAPTLLSAALVYGFLLALFAALASSVQLTEGLLATQGLFGVAIGAALARLGPGLLRESRPVRVYAIRGTGALLIVAGAALMVLAA
jgi:drug/metabolite transporter (DMT)-like permease